jgi:hypothetical protein
VGERMEFTDLKAPEPLQGRPPWQDPQWLAAAEDWIDAECARAAMKRTGLAQARARPYSVVARVPTDGGTVWFKASPPAGRFEPALLVALAAWQPDRFAAPIAVDLDRAWSLTRDGGPTLREQQSSAPDDGRWPGVLRGYAQLQADLTRQSAGLLALGLADLRPGSVPGQFERLLGDPAFTRAADAPGGITRGQHEGLRALAPRLREWCAELDDLGIPASVDHADVHPGNIFAASGVPFDWGDAAVAHPFSSLLVALRTAAEHTRLAPRSPQLAVLTTSYLSPWLEAGYSRAAVDRAVPLALRIAPLARVLTWGRLFPCYLGHPGPAVHSARALAAMLKPDPLSAGDLLCSPGRSNGPFGRTILIQGTAHRGSDSFSGPGRSTSATASGYLRRERDDGGNGGGRVRPRDGALPARTAGALLSDDRLAGRGRGPGAGDLPAGLAVLRNV